MLTREAWETKVQKFEAGWWGDCCNSYGEETKQIAYAKVMGLDPGKWQGGDHWPIWDFSGLKVVDVGGGPSSMLLKSAFGFAAVVDPCPYPEWVRARYDAHGVVYEQRPAEDVLAEYADVPEFDVALMYNVLQHTIDPDAILMQLGRVAKRIHIFEWVDLKPHPGHPHMLDADHMAELLPDGNARHVWFDEQYKEIGASSRSPVRQHGWGGVFGALD